MSVIQNNLLMTPEGYQISRSVRLRSSASAYFSRTPASAGNRKTWTWSGWVRRGTLGTSNRIFSADDGSASTDQDYNTLFFNSSDQLQFSGNLTNFRISTAVYRDPSAWYHIVFAVDTTQATAANRFKLYVNGSEVTSFGTSNNPSQNTDLAVNAAIGHFVGSIASGSYFDGYLTEVNFIDGQALTPSSFGETDAVTGVWKPKKYAGTYGTNGFYLNFSDNSNNTATTIGKDSSGNGNNWTPNNISVTAGVTYDSMLDVPTMYADGGNGRGNYCVLNRLDADTSAVSTSITNGNLTASGTTYGATVYTCSMQIPQTGKWYWEVVYSTITNTIALGVRSNSTGSTDVQYYSNGNKNVGGTTTSYGSTWTTGDIIACAVDRDAGTVTWYKNNVSQGAINIPTNSAIFDIAFNVLSPYGSTTFNVNFGQRPFAYTPPTGFKALNTQNLPDATIKKGNAYFDVLTYTGNGATQTISGLNFQPDLVWGKARSDAIGHNLFDAVRGGDRQLVSNTTAAETVRAGNAVLFNSNGITLNATYCNINNNAVTNVAWNWKESVTAGFDIVTYTGNGSTQTIAHSLGVAPKMMIVKKRSAAERWCVYHTSTSNAYIYLNETFAAETANAALRFGNNSAVVQPTSSVFSIGSANDVNGNTGTYVAYLFSEVAGFSKFGSYTGNGSVDGPFVFTGMKSRFIMIKESSGSNAASASWIMFDTSRDVDNVTEYRLFANLSDAEVQTSTVGLDILSNGFKPRTTNFNINESGGTYIYAAFAENPFKNSLAR